MIFRINAIVTFLVLAVTSTTQFSVDAKEDVDKSVPCYDYSKIFGDLAYDECKETTLFKRIKEAFNEQNDVSDTKCKGGLSRDLNAITNTVGQGTDAGKQALQDMCDDALADATEAAMSKKDSWEFLESPPHTIDLEEYFDGKGYLNDETGNFQQDENDFLKDGYDKYNYIGDDVRLNDHYHTSDVSYYGGEAIYKFYQNEAKSAYLNAPTLDFEGGCGKTNAAVCCWHRDRQYFDKNGNCKPGDCANQNPGDNTDLCWMETEDGPFAYPEDVTEGDLHCHGFAWSTFEETYGDVNTNAKWNNLFYVSMYDHLYTRGYANSITDDPKIAGEQAMCGCVEEMSSAIARADCTEAVGKTNYTSILNEEGLLVIEQKPDTFFLKFRACEGFDYDDSITPEEFNEEYNFNYEDAGLERSDNDLSAFVFRQYLEGKVTDNHVEEYEKTVVGYRDPSVNDSDEERNILCEEKFTEKFNEEFIEREVIIEEMTK